ncbi:MAG: hypothetical protein AAGG44_10390, partial [Planctomycetota bacterium]
SELEPLESCRSFIELANFRGGADNITSIVAKLHQPDDDQPKTRVAAEVTLERLLSDVTGYHPRQSSVPGIAEVPVTAELIDTSEE